MPDDSDITRVLPLLKALRLTVHVRGTDERPVVEFKDRLTRSVVGGSELKRRIEYLNNGS